MYLKNGTKKILHHEYEAFSNFTEYSYNLKNIVVSVNVLVSVIFLKKKKSKSENISRILAIPKKLLPKM